MNYYDKLTEIFCTLDNFTLDFEQQIHLFFARLLRRVLYVKIWGILHWVSHGYFRSCFSKLKTAEYLCRYQGLHPEVDMIYRFLHKLSDRLKKKVEQIAFAHSSIKG